MSQNNRINKCFPAIFTGVFALFVGFWGLTPTASMQEVIVTEEKLRTGNVSVTPTPEPPKSIVRGRIIYAETGRPVRRAGFILLNSNLRRADSPVSGVTNERGEFELKNIREGRYFVSVSLPGVLSPFSSLSSLNDLERNSESVSAVISRDFQEIVVSGGGEIDTTVSVKRGAAITGRIVYSDGEPAPGVRVEILRKTEGQYSAVIPNISDILGAFSGGAAGGMKTDDRGMFRVSALPAGEYVVRVVENAKHGESNNSGREEEILGLLGMNPNSMLATYFPNTANVDEAEIIKLELGQETPEIFITIPNRSIQNVGIIVLNKATRQPLKGMRVSLKGSEKVNTLFASLGDIGGGTRTDEQGRMSFKELPSGKYSVIVLPPAAYENPEEDKPNKPKMPKLARTEKEFTVEDKEIENFVIEVAYGATVSGTVRFEKNEDLPTSLKITAADIGGKFSENDFVGQDYRDGKYIPKKIDDFKIDGLPTGKVSLNAASLQYGPQTEDSGKFYVKSILLNGKEIRRLPLDVKEGEEIKGVQIILSKDVGKVKGKVTRSDNKPAVAERISFVSTDKNFRADFTASLLTVTDSNGEFEISGEPGEYSAVFINTEDAKLLEETKGKMSEPKYSEWLEKKTANAEKVTLKAKETETLNIKLP